MLKPPDVYYCSFYSNFALINLKIYLKGGKTFLKGPGIDGNCPLW
jgi:hypothetical protein